MGLFDRIFRKRSSRKTGEDTSDAVDPRQEMLNELNKSAYHCNSHEYKKSFSKLIDAEKMAVRNNVEHMWSDPGVREHVCDLCNDIAGHLADDGREDDALRVLHWQRKRYPDDFGLHHNLGRLSARRKDFREAIAEYEHALRVAPQHENLEPERFALCVQCLAGMHYEVGARREAVACMENALREREWPQQVRADLEQTLEAIRSGTAIIQTNRQQENKAREYTTRANELDAAGRFSEACNLYEEALRLSPHDPGIHYNYAVAYTGQGDSALLEKAMHHYREAIRLNPEYADAHANLGSLYLHMQDFEQAIAHLEKARQAGLESAPCYLRLGAAHMKNADYEEGIRLLNVALSLNPGDAVRTETHSFLAGCYLGMENYEEAIRYFSMVLDSQPGDGKRSETHRGLSMAYDQVGRAGYSAAHLEKALEFEQKLGQTSADGHVLLAKMFAGLGLFDAARDRAQRASVMDLADKDSVAFLDNLLSTPETPSQPTSETLEYEQCKAELAGEPVDSLPFQVVTADTIVTKCKELAAALGKTYAGGGSMMIEGDVTSYLFHCDDGRLYKGVLTETEIQIFDEDDNCVLQSER